MRLVFLGKRVVVGLMAAGFLTVSLAGCGASAAKTSATATGTSASTSASHTVKPHKKHKKLMRVHGTVTAVTSTTLTVNNKKGKTFTFALTSKTKYRLKKASSSLSAVKTGIKVVVAAQRSKTSNPTAVVVRIL